ncbi:ADP-ribose pyrophosphatase YjhB, NUDIX family [Pedococcus cremeus]|uniref:ADP-ribose pyrophosphatase YjhB, NUDIX family n=1 Tax=Pedococcus cremeus TaxID=587636 RepID=A0A1H9XI47_9MICO|nr:NUDIX domain-containing protein [Pedococcus cremeus]SES45729.1 ADP-ribose pyrophosphatase YjhB, NUDIX family [Pedococcus cremeus]
MARRIDYYDDPDAPKANSIRPSAGAFVQREGKILLIQRSDNGNWSMPGGAQDPGESLTRTAVRETLEESGVHVRVTGLVGIFTDPRHVVHYTSNDEVRQEFTVIYRADYVDGDATESDESTHVGWFTADEIVELRMDPSQRKRLEWAVSREEPYIDPEGD